MTGAALRDVSDAKDEALHQWNARPAAIRDEYHTNGPVLDSGGGPVGLPLWFCSIGAWRF
ncbi:MAG: hypothetical protein ACK5PT_07485 [Cereibacter sp.]